MTNSFAYLPELYLGVLQVECATVYLPTWSSSMQYLRIYINTAYISIWLMFLGNTFFGLFGWFYLSPNLFISAWCSLESSRVHTQITYFRGLDIGTERVVFILFWCFKLWNFISSIQFTCIKCGIRKCKIDVCMYS